MKRILLPLLLLIQAFLFQAHADNPLVEQGYIGKISDTFADLDKKNRYTDQLTHVDMNVLPIGFKQTISNQEFSIAISSIQFFESHAEVTLFARMKTAEGKTPLFFAAQGVKFSYSGNIIGDASLMLVQDLDIPINGHMHLKLLGGGWDTTTGRTEGITSVTVDCGGFKKLSMAGSLIFSKEVLTKIGPDGIPAEDPVSANFEFEAQGWNDMLMDITLPPFQVTGIDGFVFTLSNAVFDFSDLRNASDIVFPDGYLRKYTIDGSDKLWRGVYAGALAVSLPREFSKDSEPATFTAQNMIIDDNGVSGLFSAENLIPIETGSAGGWAFSIDKFYLGLEAHKINRAGFAGMLGLPVSDTTLLKYDAQILGNNNYQMVVVPEDTIDFNCFMAKAHLLPNSYVKMTINDGKFLPEACLNGYMNMDLPTSSNTTPSDSVNNKKKAKLNLVEFRQLHLRTYDPYLTVEYFGYNGKIQLLNFPVSISDIQFTSNGKKYGLGFNLALNLDSQFVAAKTRLTIKGKYHDTGTTRDRWVFDGVEVNDIVLDNCEIAGVLSLDGRLKIMDNDPLYGDGFFGEIGLEFKKVIKGCKVNMAAAFGNKDDYRYWFVDGSVVLPKPINVGGVLGIKGLGGGVSNRMKRTIGKGLGLSKTGCGYMPQENMGMGFKAAVFFATDGDVMGGDASFEIQLNRHGGVDLIGFYGYVEFMAAIPGLDNLTDQISGKFNELVDLENKFIADNPGIADALRKTKQYEPSKAADQTTNSKERAQQANFAASAGILYDFSQSTLHANFVVYVNAAGGLLRGTAPGNRMGEAVFHADPHEWYLYLGTPDVPFGLQVGIPGIASLKTSAYFMMGDNLPGSPPPPDKVADILNEKRETFDYMRDLNALKAGKGIAFGSSLDFSTGDLQFLILYARFDAGVGFDIMLKDYRNAQCRGRSGPIGMNGWYANGQAYAYLAGELGVKVNLWFVKGKFTIIKGGTAAILQAKLPNPTWFRGNMGVDFNLLGGLVKGNMRFKFTVGDECELLLPGTSPVDVMMISDLSPGTNASEVDVFTAPQLALSMAAGKPFDADLEDGKKTFRINLNKFVVKDGSSAVAGDLSWNKDQTVVTFVPHEVLPPVKDLKMEVAVGFEELKNGQWGIVKTGGVVAEETRDVSFTTGSAPDHIPAHNIVYAYPMVDQKYYYPGESRTGKGYVQLKFGQEYLFPSSWKYKVVVADESGRKTQEAPFTYDSATKRLNFSMPKPGLGSGFEIGFVSESGAKKTSQETATTKETVLLKEDESLVVQQGAKSNIVIRDSEGKLVLNYRFSSSKFNTFADKVKSIKKLGNSPVTFGPYIFETTHWIDIPESFDETEILGTDASGGAPLVRGRAKMTDKFYKQRIAPMLYNGYPLFGISLKREGGTVEIPPANAITGRIVPEFFPFYYSLPSYYYYDFDEIRTRAANTPGGENHPALQETYFPDIVSDQYPVELQYYLPGGETGKSKVTFDYIIKK